MDYMNNGQLFLEDVVQPNYSQNLLVIQANELVRSQQDTLTLIEAKIIRLAIAQILKNDTDFRTYEIDILSLAKLLRVESGNIYRDMDRITTDLMRKVIHIRRNAGGRGQNYLKLHWVDTVEYENGILTFKLSEELRPYLLGLQELFSMYEYQEVIELPTTNSIRLFELLTSYQNMPYRGIHNKEYNRVSIEDGEVVFTVDYLKDFFNCRDLYANNNGNFMIKVIRNSVNQINKNTIMRVTYRTQNDEHSRRRIKYVIFKIGEIGS